MSHPKPVEPCMVRVVVRSDSDPDAPPVHDREGDHNYSDFREWMGKTAWWAARNGFSMSMYPITYTNGRVAQR